MTAAMFAYGKWWSRKKNVFVEQFPGCFVLIQFLWFVCSHKNPRILKYSIHVDNQIFIKIESEEVGRIQTETDQSVSQELGASYSNLILISGIGKFGTYCIDILQVTHSVFLSISTGKVSPRKSSQIWLRG